MFNKKQKNALLKLYEKEICRVLESLYFEPQKAGDLEDLLELNRIKILIDEMADATEFGIKLFEELSSSCLSNQFYEQILAFLIRMDEYGRLHKLLACADENSRRSEFRIILDNLDVFMKFTCPKETLNFLERHVRYLEIVSVLKREIKSLDDDEEMAKKLILRTIPLLGEMSAYDVMYAIYSRSSQNIQAEAQEAIEAIQPQFSKFYKQIEEEWKNPRGKIVVCPISSSLTEMMSQLGCESIRTNPRFTIVDLAWERMPQSRDRERMIVESIKNRIHLETPLLLRDYQKELCTLALQGHNTIVTAPTGSGKTVIAANILKEHFEKARRLGARAKALFMTPNSVILQQQATSISKFLNHIYLTKVIHGADNEPTREAVISNDLIVSTPQMIVNLCNEHIDNVEVFKVEEFFLSEFTLIIFDECHSTQKNTPYANIMKKYHYLKNTGLMPPHHQLPQIIGLTASLGVGSAKDVKGAFDHIAELCSNMDVKKLSVVQNNISELRNFSPIVPDKCVHCPKNNQSTQEFVKCLIRMMMKIEQRLLEIIQIETHLDVIEQAAGPQSPFNNNNNNNSSMLNVFKKPLNDKEQQAYENWVTSHMNLVSTTIFKQNQYRKSHVYECLEILKECHLSLVHSSDFNTTSGLENLEEYFESKKRFLTREMMSIFEENFTDLKTLANSENSLITSVEEYLINQYENQNDFRAIIFVRTRKGAKVLMKILNERDELSRRQIVADYISGINKSGTESSESRKDQQEKLENFANGSIKVLVATSVAEEGLDVAKCNLVIKYNYATNEIAHVQRRGRGRALNSVCVLITNNEKLKKQEDTNRNKEFLMNQALEMILKNSVVFESSVEKKNSENWKAILKEDEDREKIITNQILEDIDYHLCCKKCSIKLCQSKDMRCSKTQYFACDPNIWNLIKVIPLSIADQERDQKFHGKGVLKCRGQNCGAQLGRLIETASVNLPCLSAESLVLKYEKNRKEITRSVKKWKEILTKYFTPINLRAFDIKTMQDSYGKVTSFNISEPNQETSTVFR